ncbi:MAG: hypothetical protein EBZ69_05850 [Alphaproteobacteria bacterium]|nr:hypothetical protein [Alphaproteobacteria bacterium]
MIRQQLGSLLAWRHLSACILAASWPAFWQLVSLAVLISLQFGSLLACILAALISLHIGSTYQPAFWQLVGLQFGSLLACILADLLQKYPLPYVSLYLN